MLRLDFFIQQVMQNGKILGKYGEQILSKLSKTQTMMTKLQFRVAAKLTEPAANRLEIRAGLVRIEEVLIFRKIFLWAVEETRTAAKVPLPSHSNTPILSSHSCYWTLSTFQSTYFMKKTYNFWSQLAHSLPKSQDRPASCQDFVINAANQKVIMRYIKSTQSLWKIMALKPYKHIWLKSVINY